MKNLFTSVAITIFVISVWVVMKSRNVGTVVHVPQELLEISIPISGTIDVEYLSELGIPAHE